MAKQRDFLDYLNTGANLAQAAQLASIRNELASASENLARKEFTAEMQAKARRFLATNERMLQIGRQNFEEGDNRTAYVAARFVKDQLDRCPNSVTLFTDWADIDRANAIMAKLDSLLADAAKPLPAEIQQHVSKCFRWQEEMAELDELISLIQQQDNLTPEARELLEAEAELKNALVPELYTKRNSQIGGTTIMFVIMAVISVVFIVFAFQADGDLRGMLLIVGALIFGIGGACWAGSIARDWSDGSPDAEAYKILLRRVEGARIKVLGGKSAMPAIDKARLKHLAAKFGGAVDSKNLVALRDDRQNQYDALFEVGGNVCAGATVPAVERQREFDVVLTSVPADKKIAVIKAVREIKGGLDLAEAKELVEAAPKPVLKRAAKADAEAAKKKLEEAGGKVEIM
jgi:large subunit ribosomal protein L7/L12